MAKTFAKLTRLAMRKLAPGASLIEHGICFERGADGDGVFTVNVMVDGQRIHRVVGRESDGTTRTQAEEFIAKVRSDARNSRLALPKGRKVALSFRDAAASYLDRLAETGAKDVQKKAARLNLHLVPFFGQTPLNKITGFDIERYKHQRLQEANLVRPRGKIVERAPDKVTLAKPGTVNRELAVLSHLFNKAIEWGWINGRPAKIKLLPEPESRFIYLTTEEAARLVECAKADGNDKVYPFTVIALETSMRLMEVLSIRKRDVDLGRMVIYVPQAKGGAREQPMTKHLAEFIAAHIERLQPGVEWLFPSPGARSGHTTDIRKAFRRAVSAAGLNPDEILRHTMRHTAISHAVQAGIDLPTVQRISGHKTLAMVLRYAHRNASHIQDAMDKLDNRYRSGSALGGVGAGNNSGLPDPASDAFDLPAIEPHAGSPLHDYTETTQGADPAKDHAP